ncbi:membrane protein [Streptococcus porcinus]|uniref:Membrane protein n=1 Tax=Streptococcus porcinus TaxID=1340 RepID=A0A4V0HAA5_STRPO|nr:hypothetical protein [Streptococcus porcinus]VTS35056.1 membrane protein [Streptococcus porcinus]VTT44879.1 membrane protein [Streptococcus porcinus]VTT46330.1 membrane protein [Streptococcus porcinus]
MKKAYISYLSAAIFILYGYLYHKWTFLGVGAVIFLIGLADHLKK